jgi:hypothetical protein
MAQEEHTMTMKPSYDNPFNGIVEGMPVFDSNGERIGTVAEIHLGGHETPDPNKGDSKSMAGDIQKADQNKPQPDLTEMFNGAVSDEVAQAMMLNGYIRIDSAELTGASAYVMPDRISEVYDGQIKLASSLRNLKEWPHPTVGGEGHER